CRVESSGPLSPDAVRCAHRIAVRLLGLGSRLDPTAFERRVAARPRLRRLIDGRAGLRLPRTADPFEALTWAIIGQQINLSFAAALRRALIELCGAPAGGGFRAHPDADAVARLDYGDLTARRFSRRKAEYLIDAARLVASGALPIARLSDGSASRLERRLLEVRGVGPWTAQYVMLRGCGLADCVPVGDSGLTEALRRFFELPARPDRERTLELMRPFAPYRSLATAHFWAMLASSG
ncbi:MAG: DNA-3-methyladenine glycosylase family protein, partial [Gemmatimonadota bacterium]